MPIIGNTIMHNFCIYDAYQYQILKSTFRPIFRKKTQYVNAGTDRLMEKCTCLKKCILMNVNFSF